MRTLREHGTLDILSSEIFSVLQLCAIGEPLFPHLKILGLWNVTGKFVPFIPLFLSPRTTIIRIRFNRSDSPTAMVAPMVAALPTLCPNLQEITFHSMPRDPMIVAAVSRMLIASNRDILQSACLDSPLTEEARGAISKFPNLRNLSVAIERDTSLPSVDLPNLVALTVKYDRGDDWLPMFYRATFGKLENVTFISESEQNDDFLEAFERVALAASIQNTLTQFSLYTPRSWNPNYSSLLPFTQLTNITIGFPCDDDCSSKVDDDIITNLARAMPKLQTLQLGEPPCSEIPIGITVKGLVVLANRCPDLYDLQIHFQVASLSTPVAIHRMTSNVESTARRRDCGLSELVVGEIPMPDDSVSVVALTLARIFPHLGYIDYVDENWEKVLDAIFISKKIVDYSGKEVTSLHLEVTLVTPPQKPHSKMVISRERIPGLDTSDSNFTSNIPLLSCPMDAAIS